MKINREGKSKVLDTEQLDLLLDYLPNKKHNSFFSFNATGNILPATIYNNSRN